VNGFREAVQDRISSLLDRVDELKLKQYPTPASNALLDVVGAILKQIPRKLDDYDPRFAPIPGARRRSHGHLSQLLSSLHELMFIINETSRAKTPAALISSLRATVREHTGTRVELLIRPDSQGIRYTYADLGTGILKVLEEASDFVDAPTDRVIESLEDGVVVLTYPAAERNNVILHGIFLHEIGHHITDCTGVLQRVTDAFPLEPPLDKWPQVWVSWLWEFAADLAAIRLAGPAYLFGIYQNMLATEVLDLPSDTHPPPWRRVRLMLDELRLAGFLDGDCMPPAVLAHITRWEEDLAAAEALSRVDTLGPVIRALVEKVEEVLPRISEEVRAAIPNAFTAEAYRRECPRLGAQLRHLMPLNEWYDPETDTWPIASFAGILNTGWNFVLGELEGFYAEIRVTSRDEQEALRRRIFDLIAKSVEFAQLRKDVEASRRPSPSAEAAA
jgi:hypothetical protein